MTKFILALALLWSSAGSAGDPFVGHWKIDIAKSQLTGSPFHDGAYFWPIKADGTRQPTAFGDTAMKVVDARTWQFADTSNGKPTGQRLGCSPLTATPSRGP
jgi:hypothetical protein